MEKQFLKRTTGSDADFVGLIQQLDNELWNEMLEDQATYDQYNKVPDISTALVLYIDNKAAAIGCFKKFNADTVEVKRMFVVKEHRKKGLSKIILSELESWALENGFKNAVLETAKTFTPAITLYTNAGFSIIPNYDQYVGMEDSVCMGKKLVV